MAHFLVTHDSIDASRRRIVSLWFGDVDRLVLQSVASFTGTAVMAAVYTLSGVYQHHIVFIALDHHIEEVWHVDPQDVPIPEAGLVQRDILRCLRDRGIGLHYISSENAHYQRILSMLPLAWEEGEKPAFRFSPADAQNHSGILSDEDRMFMRGLFVHF